MRKQIMIVSAGAFAALVAHTGCVNTDKGTETASGGASQREVAAQMEANESALIFHSTKVRRGTAGMEIPTQSLTEAFTPLRWVNLPAKDSARRQKLLEFYFANTRAKSDSGRRNIACFTGTATEAEANFFKNVSFSQIENLRVSKSSDGLMIGIDFRVFHNNRWSQQHFRMPNCLSAGKNFFFEPQDLISAIRAQKTRDARAGRDPQAEPALEPQFTDKDLKAAFSRSPAAVKQEGYLMLDQVSGAPSDGKLPRFEIKADYDKAHRVREEFPWRKERLDLSREEDAFRFAMILKKYVYDGMGNQHKNPSMNLIAQKSPRYWCHMPWLNQGTTGREAIHGLTQERDLAPSLMYPDAAPGSDWGGAVFNAPACQAIDRVFGPQRSPRTPPQSPEEWHAKTDSPDGSVIAKFLFTTAAFPAIQDAWQVIAHVSPPKSTTRSLQPVRHIQLDIAIKDSTLRGVPIANADNWLMLTYYYDANYTDAEEIGTGLPMPEGIKRMRPLGIQWGFTKADSRIFQGGVTNNKGGLLNGPADNIRSSCLGCHGAAGTTVPMAPGVTTSAQYYREKEKRITLDFGQQFAFAKRNYETRAQVTSPASP